MRCKIRIGDIEMGGGRGRETESNGLKERDRAETRKGRERRRVRGEDILRERNIGEGTE